MDADTTPTVTMPKWPAWIMGGAMACFAYPAVTASAPAAEPAPPSANERFDAQGANGWRLQIAEGRIRFAGSGLDVTERRPEPLMNEGGRRYVTQPMTVEITDGRCAAGNGQSFPQQVRVVIGDQSFNGCGGGRS